MFVPQLKLIPILKSCWWFHAYVTTFFFVSVFLNLRPFDIPLTNFDRLLEEIVLQNLGSLRFQNKLPWLLPRGLLLNVENLKIQAKVVSVTPPFEMSFLLPLEQMSQSPRVAFRIQGHQVCHFSVCIISDVVL